MNAPSQVCFPCRPTCPTSSARSRGPGCERSEHRRRRLGLDGGEHAGTLRHQPSPRGYPSRPTDSRRRRTHGPARSAAHRLAPQARSRTRAAGAPTDSTPQARPPTRVSAGPRSRSPPPLGSRVPSVPDAGTVAFCIPGRGSAALPEIAPFRAFPDSCLSAPGDSWPCAGVGTD